MPQWLRRGGKELATPATPKASKLTGFAPGSAECDTPTSGARKTSRTSTRCAARRGCCAAARCAAA
jgi:hypothetical protein